MSFNCCFNCGASLSNDEIGIYKKAVNRGAVQFLCLDCLAKKLYCSREMLLEKIEHFRKSGCVLFK